MHSYELWTAKILEFSFFHEELINGLTSKKLIHNVFMFNYPQLCTKNDIRKYFPNNKERNQL